MTGLKKQSGNLRNGRRDHRAQLASEAVATVGFCLRGVERLWSRAGAINGNRWQMAPRRKRLKQAKTVAVRCQRLPSRCKEGVDGSSQSEGSPKAPEIGAFSVRPTCSVERVMGMEPFMELSRRHSRCAASPDVRSLACDGLPS